MRPPPPPVVTLPHESRRGPKTKADDLNVKLVANEQIYQEIAKTLKREERKLNKRQKQVGGSTAKLKKS